MNISSITLNSAFTIHEGGTLMATIRYARASGEEREATICVDLPLETASDLVKEIARTSLHRCLDTALDDL